MTFKVGLAMEVINVGTHKVTIASDLSHPNDNVERLNTGVEYWFNEMLALRAGYVARHDTGGLNTGLGIRFPFGMANASLDYAFSDYTMLGTTHRASMTVNF